MAKTPAANYESIKGTRAGRRVAPQPTITGSQDPGRPPIQGRAFSTWDEFKNGIRANLPGASDYDLYKRFIFRGQGSADWPLRSSFDRTYSDKQAASRDTIAKELIREFYEECERYSPWRYGEDDPRVLAMAQHHGLQTRLLDWSFSPYVAAYFAFSWFLFEKPGDQKGHVAVWAINRDDVEAKAPKGQLEIVTVQDHENSRLGNQFGVFTFLKTNESSLEEYLASRPVALSHALIKFELPRTECKQALQDLMLMGIHHGTIFPGREGIAQMIRLRTLLRNA